MRFGQVKYCPKIKVRNIKIFGRNAGGRCITVNVGPLYLIKFLNLLHLSDSPNKISSGVVIKKIILPHYTLIFFLELKSGVRFFRVLVKVREITKDSLGCYRALMMRCGYIFYV